MNKIIKNSALILFATLLSLYFFPLVSNAVTMNSINITTSIPWPWYVTRASAITAYLLLFILIMSGAGIKTSFTFRFASPTTTWIQHRLVGIALTASVALHITSLYMDKYMQFSLAEILIPFISHFKPLYVAFGVFALYLLIFIMISSIFYIDKYQKQWRLIHYLNYPLFIVVAIHGFFIGSDSGSNLMQIVYPVTGAIVLLIMLYRLYFVYKQVR